MAASQEQKNNLYFRKIFGLGNVLIFLIGTPLLVAAHPEAGIILGSAGTIGFLAAGWLSISRN